MFVLSKMLALVQSGSCNFFHWIPTREREDFLLFSSSPADDARSFLVEMWTEITLIERGRSLQSKYFLYSGRYPPSLFSFSLPFLQGDFRLVDFYLNLICKKSPRVAIVIVVSLGRC